WSGDRPQHALRALVAVSRQGQDIFAVAGDTFRHLASDTGDLVESSVAVLDRLFARWDANGSSLALAPPTPKVETMQEPAPAWSIPGEAVEPAAGREIDSQPWWSLQRLAWGSVVALALVSGRLGRRRKAGAGLQTVPQQGGPDRVPIG